MEKIDAFAKKNTFKGQKIFTESPNPQEWIEWITFVFVAFAVLAVIRLFFGLLIALFYIIALAIFAMGIFRRKKIWFGILLVALIPCLLIEIYLFFSAFGYGFNLKLLLGIIFSLIGIAIVVYTAFCAYKMFKYFPEEANYGPQEDQPLANNNPGMIIKPLSRDVHHEPGLDDSKEII